jgi:hypothetical protein
MAGPSKVLDRFDQWALLSVNPTAAASGGAVNQLQTGLSTMQKVAWAVSRIEYQPYRGLLGLLTTAAHWVNMFLSASSNAYTAEDICFNSPVYDSIRWSLLHTPAALGENIVKDPWVKEYAVGRELLVLPQQIFAGVNWSFAGAAAATTCRIKVWYKEIEVTSEDWYDLLQMRMPIGAV